MDPHQPGCGHRRRREPREEPLGHPGLAVVEGNGGGGGGGIHERSVASGAVAPVAGAARTTILSLGFRVDLQAPLHAGRDQPRRPLVTAPCSMPIHDSPVSEAIASQLGCTTPLSYFRKNQKIDVLVMIG